MTVTDHGHEFYYGVIVIQSNLLNPTENFLEIL